MKKPVILCDADGVLFDFYTPALAVAAEVIYQSTGVMTDPKVDDLDTWDIFDVIGRQFERDCYLEYEKPGWCAALQPYPEALEGMREVRKIADVVVVTSPLHSPTWCYERVQALKQHFDIPRQDVCFARRKALVRGRVFIDDRPSHVEEWAQENLGVGVAVLWDQPYNRSSVIEGSAWNIMRHHSWFGSRGLLEMIERAARLLK